MATGYATLYGDMAGGFAVIKDVPKTLVYALCRDLNERAGPRRDPASGASTSRRRRSCARISSTPTRCPPYDVLDPIIEGYVEDDLSVAELVARGHRRRARAARRAHGRPQRVQAPPGAARRARVAEGVRQGPPAADHQPLARLTVDRRVSGPSRARGRRARPLLPELALIAATIAYGATFKLVQNALDDVTPVGFILLRFAIGAIVLVPFALRSGWRGAVDGVDARPRATSCSRVLAFGVVGFAGYWFQNAGLERTTTSNSAFITGLVRRVHAADRDRRDAAPPGAQRRGRGRVSRSSACSCSRARTFALHAGDALTLGVRVHVRASGSCSAACFSQRFDPIALTAAQIVVFAVLAVPVVAIGGLGHVTGRVVVAVLVTGVLCSAVAFTLQLWGQRCVEPSRAAVILLFEPVVAGIRRLSGSASGSASPATSARLDHPRRHRHRRVAVVAPPAPRT